jgi:hypothetical protein
VSAFTRLLNVVVPLKIDVPLKTLSESVGLSKTRLVAVPPEILPLVTVVAEELEKRGK